MNKQKLIFKTFFYGVLVGFYSYYLYKARVFFPKVSSVLEQHLLPSYAGFVSVSIVVLIIIGLLLYKEEIKQLRNKK